MLADSTDEQGDTPILCQDKNKGNTSANTLRPTDNILGAFAELTANSVDLMFERIRISQLKPKLTNLLRQV